MKAWNRLPLGEVCVINPRWDPGKVPAADTAVSFVPMSAVDEVSGTITRPDVRPYGVVAKGYTTFQDGDVLFAKITPCMENGKAAVARNLIGGLGVGSTEFHVLRPTGAVIPEWVFAFVRRSSFRAAAKSNFTGSVGQQRVPAEFLRRYLIPIPSLDEQRRLVELLRSVEELLALRSQCDERVSAIVPALFNEMFGDPFSNPRGWPVLPAGELMNACDYGSSQKADDNNEGVPMLRMGNVTVAGDLDLTDLKSVVLDAKELGKYQLQAGDVLFNRTNSRDLVGKTGMWDGRFEAVAASYFIRIRLREEIEDPLHFTTFMNLPPTKRRLASMARGAIGQANINAKELKSIPVPVPPIGLQIEFAERVMEVRDIVAQGSLSKKHLEQLYQSIERAAFSAAL